jgi:hypothetical protein
MALRVLGPGWIGIALALASCSSTQDPDEAARKRCEQLSDHLIDLRLADVGQDRTIPLPRIRMPPPGSLDRPVIDVPPPPVDLAAHRAAMEQALGARFVGTCTSKMTVELVHCALEAKTSAAVAACSRARPTPTTASR